MKGIDTVVKKELDEFQKILTASSDKYKSIGDFITYHAKKLAPAHAAEIVASYVALSIVDQSVKESIRKGDEDAAKS